MGWKNVQEHYKIGHIVHVTEQGICIGSPYVHDLIVIGLDGRIIKAREGPNKDLQRYLWEMRGAPDILRALITTPDTFERSIPVYTYRDAEIIEKFCEEVGWPNVTHDGALQYNNTFSTDKAKVIGWAKRSAAYTVLYAQRNLDEAFADIAERYAFLKQASAIDAKLKTDYPDTKPDPEPR